MPAGEGDALVELGAALHRARTARGMSLRGWAKALGLSAHSGLVDYERGARLPPADIVEASERIFQLPAGQLVALRDRALAARADHAATQLLAVRQDRPTTPRPAQLPADLVVFTGRGDELAQLLAADQDLLASADLHGPPTAPTRLVIGAIDGMAGVGKTTLAVHAAHRLEERYPDGQLFIDLHGYTEAVSPVEPGDALDRLLRALAVPGERIPDQLDDRAALWRSILAGRRMLIVLDNAVTEEQVAPLLPGEPGCLVLITSRRRLAALEATHTLSLDTLPVADAVTLFARTAGEDRLADQPSELVAETVALCGQLPLAIRIAAARLRSRPAWGVAELVERLRDQDQRLGELAVGQRSVTAALELSYQQLTTDQQRTYRLLGLHPGPSIDTHAAAALACTPAVRARRLLDQLLDAHLLLERSPGRYLLHDLVRAHAAGTAEVIDSEPAQRSALTSLFDHYRHAASVAMDSAYPYERERRPRVPPAEVPVPDFSSPDRAIGWLDIELPNLLATAQYAADHGWPEYAPHLSGTLHRHLRTRSHYRSAEKLHTQALTVARATGNRTGELDALVGLGEIQQLLRRFQPAIDNLRRALEVARGTGHRAGELYAQHGLSNAYRMVGRYEQSIEYAEQTLEIARAIGHHAGELYAQNGLGHVHYLRGRYEQAIHHFGRALELARAIGHHAGELNARIGLGYVYLRQGQHERATAEFEGLLGSARAVGDRVTELGALTGLGKVYQAQGRLELAADYYQQLLDLARQTDHRNWQFEALHGLGRVHHLIGHPAAARSHHQQAIELVTELGQPADQARAHDGLAHAYDALDQPELARRHWQRALDILTSLGTDHTEDEQANAVHLRAHLARLGAADVVQD